MPIQELKEEIARLPAQPGVYLYFNAEGATIYIGKARVLRDRVRSYLSAAGSSPKTDALLEEVARLEVIVTDSVVEALALENNLVKQRTPKYNILLRDDKSYPYLQLTTNEAFPRVLVARRVERDGSVYAGPFLPAQLARRTMGLTHRLFGVRSVRQQKRIEVVVQLADWESAKDADRTGLTHADTVILDVSIPKVIVPLNPGKNITVISEVVAMAHLLRYSGVDMAAAFNERLIRKMKEQKGVREYLQEDYE